uniref:Uncharacterized protein n=1 Tax=Panagrellus redivivus TaxID=6233 RepID=A0A7E4V4T4_PANRE
MVFIRCENCFILLVITVICSLFSFVLANKYSRRIYLNDKFISGIDPTRDGFRILLDDSFIETHLQPTLLPTIYLTAVPLEGIDHTAVTNVVYADSPLTGKTLHIEGLQHHAWYYLCVEFENFNRQNETTGMECGVYRTLDFDSKPVESTMVNLELHDATSQSLSFLGVSKGDFERRLTFTLRHGNAPIPPSEVFLLSTTNELDLKFSDLKPNKTYGHLCVLEEPLLSAFSAMGRRISVRRETCFFGNLKTRDYDWSIFESEASPYSSTPPQTLCFTLLFAVVAFRLIF